MPRSTSALAPARLYSEPTRRSTFLPSTCYLQSMRVFALLMAFATTQVTLAQEVQADPNEDIDAAD